MSSDDTSVLETVTVTAGGSGVRGKWDRYISLKFTNRAGKIDEVKPNGDLISSEDLITTIPPSLKVEFEFNKELDHSDGSDSGSIVIHGLTSKTAESIGGLFTTVECRVGYLGDLTATNESSLSDEDFDNDVAPTVVYSGSGISTLFRADVIDAKYEKTTSGTVTTLQVSSNINKILQGSRLSQEIPVPSPLPNSGKVDFKDLPVETAYKVMFGYLFPPEKYTVVSTPAANAAFDKAYRGQSLSVFGTIKSVLDELFRPIGVSYRIKELSATMSEVLVFVREDVGKVFGQDVLVISEDSGLIGLPYLRSDTVTRAVGEETESNEAVLNQQQRFGKDGSPKEVKKYKARRYGVGFTALLDPTVEPQTVVKIVTQEGTTDGLYRVRNVKFKGDNFGSDWIMEVQCENQDKA